MTHYALYALIGLIGGAFSGLFGIGGGIIVVPILVFLMGFSQHNAQGTTLAMMIPPVGILAAWTYYSKGYVDIRIALFMAVGFMIGGFLGSKYAVNISSVHLMRAFGVLLLIIAVRMIVITE